MSIHNSECNDFWATVTLQMYMYAYILLLSKQTVIDAHPLDRLGGRSTENC